MSIVKRPTGLTVAELKAIISTWPDTFPDGEPCEVWLGDVKGVSNVAIEVSSLGGGDLLISHVGRTLTPELVIESREIIRDERGKPCAVRYNVKGSG